MIISYEDLFEKINNNEIFGYVYLTTNINNNKIYIGQSKKLDKNSVLNYYGSGKIISKVNKLYLKKEIIGIAYNLYELSDLETYFINLYKSFERKIGYNISKTATYFNERNISGQDNPCSKTNMSGLDLKSKGKKAAKTNKERKNFAGDNNPASIKKMGLEKIKNKNKKSHRTAKAKGSDKTRIENGRQTKLKNGIYFSAAAKAAKTTIKNGSLKGKNNPKAKKIILISPDNKIIKCHGNLKETIEEYGLEYRVLLKNFGLGKIEIKSKNVTSKKTINTIGWEIREVKE